MLSFSYPILNSHISATFFCFSRWETWWCCLDLPQVKHLRIHSYELWISTSTFALSYVCPVVYNLSPCHRLSIALLPLSWFAYLEGDIKEVGKQILCFSEYFVKHTSKSGLTFNDLHQFSSGSMCSFFVVIMCICFGYKLR